MAPGPDGGALGRVGRFLEIQNLGLNLPFVLAFLLTASGGVPTLRDGVLIVVAFVAGRNAGHSFNRWSDRDLDARNPRTADRWLARDPSHGRWALAFAAANLVVLAVCAAALSPLALALVPVAGLLVLGYSYTKRVTSLTTVFLGLVEAVAPAGVYAGITDALPLAAWLAIGAVLAWGTAFETIHSLGDLSSDLALGLRSVPVAVGPRAARAIVPASHAIALGLFAVFGLAAHLRIGYFGGLAAMGVLVAVVDAGVVRGSGDARRAFRAHFVLSGIFLVAVVLGLFAPAL